jgi:hypothetical protein
MPPTLLATTGIEAQAPRYRNLPLNRLDVMNHGDLIPGNVPVTTDRRLARGLEWERGKAWAFEQSMGVLWYHVQSNPPMSRTGRRTLERILRNG